ncbi:hypothetical protein B0H16DRAFT_1475038 [Mycena metata]|uniref:Uncharacterized protein n=1 Tax=Mycena metata TaxID=1033252 RepID=A0AAD7HG27_9AGAR|nr:hypothetical protein B0H16DRAFT_1475038 [Mycena metata]
MFSKLSVVVTSVLIVSSFSSTHSALDANYLAQTLAAAIPTTTPPADVDEEATEIETEEGSDDARSGVAGRDDARAALVRGRRPSSAMLPTRSGAVSSLSIAFPSRSERDWRLERIA